MMDLFRKNSLICVLCPEGRFERFLQLIKRQSYHYIETSQVICRANQLTGFYMMATLAPNELLLNVK